MERNYPNISVTDKAARSLRSGHPWVYADEVLHICGLGFDGLVGCTRTLPARTGSSWM